jgi:hypothetical protein
MGWGIRGQYGHETGAMIAGLLVSLILVMIFCPAGSSLLTSRAVGFCAAAIGFGGAMTYGQTVGLTQNSAVVGNWAALGWGMLGLALKGALWIGFAGAFLGMGLSGIHYRPREMAALLGGLVVLILAGMWALNLPFDPNHRVLPRIYFSSSWNWYPSAGEELKPRREFWGGFLFALLGLILYLGWVRRDRLARNMALWGCLGGLGFPIGQSLQAWHAWHLDLFKEGTLARLGPVVNWWNFMETTFGLVLGGTLALGLWLNRRRIASLEEPGEVTIPPTVEFTLAGAHVALLCIWEFWSVGPLDDVGDVGVPRSLIPIIAIAGGRYWPYLMALPVIALPILGKTAAEFGVGPAQSLAGATACVGFPLLVLTGVALYFGRQSVMGERFDARRYLSPTLIIVTWFYFGLNYAFFRFPWPWSHWTARTPNSIVYVICASALTWAAIRYASADAPQAQERGTP